MNFEFSFLLSYGNFCAVIVIKFENKLYFFKQIKNVREKSPRSAASLTQKQKEWQSNEKVKCNQPSKCNSTITKTISSDCEWRKGEEQRNGATNS